MATAAKAEPAAAAPEGGKKPIKKLIPIIAAALVAAAAAGGGVYFMSAKKAPAKEAAAAEGEHKEEAAHEDGGKEGGAHKSAQYLSLTPSFVVNLEDDQAMRYLQVDIELMTRDEKAVENIKQHLPRIRNTLMMLFTQQHYKDIVTREGKEKLQQQALEEVQKVLKEETGSKGIEGLYFTNFVMQ